MRGGAADQGPGSLHLPFPHSVAQAPPQAPALTPLPQTCRHRGGPKVTAQGRATATAQEPSPSRRRHRVNKHHREAPTQFPPWGPTPVSGRGSRGGRPVPAVASCAASLGAGSGALCRQEQPLGGDPLRKAGDRGGDSGLSVLTGAGSQPEGLAAPAPRFYLSRRVHLLTRGRNAPRPAARHCGSAGGAGGAARSRDTGGRCVEGASYKGAETRHTRRELWRGEKNRRRPGMRRGKPGQGEGAGKEGGPEMERGARGETARDRGQREQRPRSGSGTQREKGREPAERHFKHKRRSPGVGPERTV